MLQKGILGCIDHSTCKVFAHQLQKKTDNFLGP